MHVGGHHVRGDRAGAHLDLGLHQHRRRGPRLPAGAGAGPAAAAAMLRPGQKASFELRAVEAVGEGLMRWTPDGQHIVAKWDFVAEND